MRDCVKSASSQDERLTQSQKGESRVTVLQVADGKTGASGNQTAWYIVEVFFRGSSSHITPYQFRVFTPCPPLTALGMSEHFAQTPNH